jgi:hypothetical protein
MYCSALKIIHIFASILLLVGPFYFTDPNILLALIIYANLIYFNWAMFGGCVITWLENYLDDSENICKYECGRPKSTLVKLIESFGINETQIDSIFNIIPLLAVCVCVYKLYYAKCFHMNATSPNDTSAANTIHACFLSPEMAK